MKIIVDDAILITEDEMVKKFHEELAKISHIKSAYTHNAWWEWNAKVRKSKDRRNKWKNLVQKKEIR